ncbi:MAG: glycosyltransferase [Candidatus Methylomirabilia bacterium]
MADVDRADIVVGIPSYNSADTIGHVVAAVDLGLSKYFPDMPAVIINSDGGSKDGTPGVVRGTRAESRTLLLRHPLHPVHRISTPYHGIPGKGSAVRTIIERARDLGARACAIVDSDLRSITPEWIELLLGPVLREDYDFVAPLYQRHKFDGTITNSIVYPMTRALYGRRVRQPIGGEFGFSAQLAEHYLRQDVWGSDVARFGIDIWMTTEAVANDFKVCQSYLGAKIHGAKDPGSDLGDMLVQVVGSLFELTAKHRGVWNGRRGSTDVDTFGFRYDVGLEHVSVNVARMRGIFAEGLKNLGEIWRTVLGAGDFGEIEPLGAAPDDRFRFTGALWARTVYDFALAHHHREIPSEHLLRAFLPLYLGRTASFVLEAATLAQAEVEALIDTTCLEFERQKEYLERSWV